MKQWIIAFENGMPTEEEKKKIADSGMQVLQEHDFATGFTILGFGSEDQAEEIRKTTSAVIHENTEMSICGGGDVQ